ncbi:ubiquitin-conjugating enzyme e2 19 [Nicotiana attenuata]|uniref:Ubiquitin-conjugating enzyme e2 19 n=1 Tax=Nicotiana attenuata TaxID=49451 RepID=A0A314L2V4_NICAT|nr:ubiquitin-conjugating enzyme e2 19 [Nicotiana attenuata]
MNSENNNNTPATAQLKQTLPTGKIVDTQSALKRLQYEFMAIMITADSKISTFSKENNIFIWKWTISGSKDTIFEGKKYKLYLSFHVDYPFKPPSA